MQAMTSHSKQRGAALVIGLILLVVITVLAISGINTATTELAMARNDQNYENAFQAAETGLELAMAQGFFETTTNTTITQSITSNEKVTAEVQFDSSTLAPGFSLGSTTGIAAYHFIATADAVSERDPGNPSDRDASARHTQVFYVVGPQSPTL
jgi:type IV pilus assembly protein PilX